MSAPITTCTCANCAGSSCTCGCQGPKVETRTGCKCGAACSCGPNCGCKAS